MRFYLLIIRKLYRNSKIQFLLIYTYNMCFLSFFLLLFINLISSFSNYSITIVYLARQRGEKGLCRFQRQTELFFSFSACAFITGYYFIRSLTHSPSTGTTVCVWVVASKTLSIILVVRLCVGQFQQPRRNFMNYLFLTFNIVWYSVLSL